MAQAARMQPYFSLSLVACALLLSCAPTPDDPIVCGEDDAPITVTTATRSPDGEGWCCVRGYPTCGCGYFGGFVRDRCSCAYPSGTDESPSGYCDLAPADWISETDEHGCLRWRARSPTTECCNCIDAG